MNYEILFYCIVWFIIGRLSTLKVYIGPDRDKYAKANFGILLKP